MTTILLTGTNAADKRAVERALYTGWALTGWTESAKGFAVLITQTGPGADPAYQTGRLQSFGTWGVRLDPTPSDIVAAIGRIRP